MKGTLRILIKFYGKISIRRRQDSTCYWLKGPSVDICHSAVSKESGSLNGSPT